MDYSQAFRDLSTCDLSDACDAIQHGGDAIALHKAMKYDVSMAEQLGDDRIAG